MEQLQAVLQYATTAAFVGVGGVALIQWFRSPSRQRAYVALALGMLGLVAAAARLQLAFPGVGYWIYPATLVAFQLSGLGLLLLRHSLIPIRWAGWILIVIALAGSAAAAILAGPPPAAGPPSPAQHTAGLAVILSWIAAVIEPSLRFWVTSRRVPHVQRLRLQALSAGYLGLVLLLLTAAVPSVVANPKIQVAISLLALALAPLLYAGISPPSWLRGTWRSHEEASMRAAMRELLLFSPNRTVLAERALGWALRLVGAGSGAVVDSNGATLAAQGSELDIEGVVERARARLVEGEVVELDRTLVIHLPLDTGDGWLVVRAGPFTPLFGGDEVELLVNYSTAIITALDRVRVSEQVAALEETKSRFLRLASHELRGPLALIRGYLTMAAERSITPEELVQTVPTLLARVDLMTTMLAQMLETARLEDERMELKPTLFDMRQAVRAVADAMAPLAGSDHPIAVRLPEQEVPVVADRVRVETIVSNLIDNAIKYSPGGGAIDCSVESVGGNALVEVKDQGIGIPQEDMGRLFTRFGRIGNPHTAAIPGTGLGLYLARELARLHHGELTATSGPGKGSTFVFRIPLAPAS